MNNFISRRKVTNITTQYKSQKYYKSSEISHHARTWDWTSYQYIKHLSVFSLSQYGSRYLGWRSGPLQVSHFQPRSQSQAQDPVSSPPSEGLVEQASPRPDALPPASSSGKCDCGGGGERHNQFEKRNREQQRNTYLSSISVTDCAVHLHSHTVSQPRLLFSLWLTHYYVYKDDVSCISSTYNRNLL